MQYDDDDKQRRRRCRVALQARSDEKFSYEVHVSSRPPLVCNNTVRTSGGLNKGKVIEVGHDGRIFVEFDEQTKNHEWHKPEDVFIYPPLPDPGYHPKKYTKALELLLDGNWTIEQAEKMWQFKGEQGTEQCG